MGGEGGEGGEKVIISRPLLPCLLRLQYTGGPQQRKDLQREKMATGQ